MGFLGGSLVGSLIDMKTLATVLPKVHLVIFSHLIPQERFPYGKRS